MQNVTGRAGRFNVAVPAAANEPQKGGRMSISLVTDFYELNMAASYLRHEMSGTATFSLFCRRLPRDRGFLVAAGLEDCLSFLEQFAFDDADIEYLASVGFGDDTLAHFRSLRFTGDVWAVPEGTIVFADEPLLEVTAPIAEAQLVETYLLNQCTFQTALATKAARCRIAAAGRIDIMDFSIRRTHGVEAGMAVARLSAMCGFAGTSNVAAAQRFALRPSGTMAHSYVESFDDELEAFVTFASDFPDQAVFLVDTYGTMAGVTHAIAAIRTLGLQDHAGIRLDSGDVVDLPAKHVSVSTQLDLAGSASSCPAGSTSMISLASLPTTSRSMLSGSALDSRLRRRAVPRHGVQACRVRGSAGREAVARQSDPSRPKAGLSRPANA